MGSGVALQVKQRFPHVYDEYLKVCSSNMLGNVQEVPCNPKYLGVESGSLLVPQGEQYICNLFAQDNYGYGGKQYTSLEALAECFKKVYGKTCERNGNNAAVVAMPYMIGCCRGGADWDTVYKMIDEQFKYRTVELWKFEE